jgi:acyl-CoA thioesterase-2
VSSSWSDLLACLELTPETPADRLAAVFEGRNQEIGYHRIFGGQLLAQAVRAAALSCPGKDVKSLHVLFPSAGRTDEPVRLEVQRHRDGGTFATLGVTGRQAKGVVATAAVSLHAAEDGRAVQTVPPPPPVPDAGRRVDLDLLPWETRCAGDLDAPAAGPPSLELWIAVPPLDPGRAQAVVAYATDLTLIGTALRPIEGIGQRDAGRAFTSAVTSHTLWFHRPFRTGGWLLLRQEAPIVAHGRSFGRGDVLTEDGELVASYAQEALLRFTA